MELTNLFTQNKKLGLNIVVCIVALIIANNIHKSQNKDIDSLGKKKETEIKKNEILVNIGSLETKLNAYKKIFDKKDSSATIDTINTLARKEDVKIISVAPAPERDYGLYVKYNFNVVVTVQSYHQLGRFIKDIESYPGMYAVDSVEIRNSVEDGSDAAQKTQLNVTISVSIISLKG